MKKVIKRKGFGYITKNGTVFKIGNDWGDGKHDTSLLTIDRYLSYRIEVGCERVDVRAWSKPNPRQIKAIMGFDMPILFEYLSDCFETKNPANFPIEISKIKF